MTAASPSERPVAVVGSGVAGTILARLLNARGRRVTLIERAVHPRFSLGESSTPLASICLERLAHEYGLPDLLALAQYGRWNRELPAVGHGLKRGFSFYGHRPGRAYANGPTNDARLLVAASPDDGVADSHWLRADVDRHLVERATAEGVALIDGCAVEGVARADGRWTLSATRGGRPIRLEADFVVDATGGGSDLIGRLAAVRTLPERPGRVPGLPSTGLVFGHFGSVGSFVDAAGEASFDDAPYPEERAAVHHLLDEGWMYVLPFDDGVVSAGFVIDRSHADASRLLAADPADAWRELLGRYPTLDRQFAGSDAVRPIGRIPALQRRAPAAAGDGWAALPHAYSFVSPMFSTGIAWSLFAVERLAHALAGPDSEWPFRLTEYDWLLGTEADHIAALVSPAYRYRRDFDAFSAWSYVYFAAASFSEACQRLLDLPPDGEWHATGFLGACDPAMRRAAHEALRDLDDRPRPDPLDRRVGQRVAPRNLAGLAEPSRNRAYPVDLDALVGAASLLGLSADEVRSRLPRLRGPQD